MQDIRQIIDAFNKKAEVIDDQKQLGNLFSVTIKQLGYDGFDAYCLMEDARTDSAFHPDHPGNFLLFDYDLDIISEYILTNWLKMDPVLPEIGKTSQPFEFVGFLGKSAQNSSVKWQLRMLKMFNVHQAWLIPLNTIGATRGVTCYIKGNTPEITKHFHATRTDVQLISGELIRHLERVNTVGIVAVGDNINLPELTARELDCLHWVALGKTNGEVAEILNVSIHTVHSHMKSLLGKLQVNTRAKAVLLATQKGLISV